MQVGTWILVAEQGSARIFRYDGADEPFTELERLDNDIAASRDREIVTDRPGRAFDSIGQHRHAMDPNVTPSEQEAIRFAKRVADHLEQARIDDAFPDLVVVAGPAFLGLLRQSMSDSLKALVRAEITKNLGSHNAAEIRRHVAAEL